MVEIRVQKEARDIKVYAFERGHPVGFAIGEIMGNAVELETIHVDACRRGDGIGSLLLTSFINQARAVGARSVSGEMGTEFGLNIGETTRFYQRHGIAVNGKKLKIDF